MGERSICKGCQHPKTCFYKIEKAFCKKKMEGCNQCSYGHDSTGRKEGLINAIIVLHLSMISVIVLKGWASTTSNL
eukprot:m.136227 g.136227  ORF g.136227 m.136227 type:complete len:76 (-) comp10523_c0_seq1:99-326(-)